MEEIKSPEHIRRIAVSYQNSRILLTAFELKIFTIIDKHMMTSDEVSKKINADARATDRLMNALCGMGLLRKVKGKFYNTDLSSKYLVEGKPEFMGNLYHTNQLWKTWSHLTDSVIKGTSFIGDQNKIEKAEWVEQFIAAMHYRGIKQGEILSMMIELGDVKKMLDVGGGSAAFSIEIVKKNPAIKAVVFDLPHVIPLTKKYVEQDGLLDNFDFIEGDYLNDDFKGGYDLILLSSIVHINSYQQNKMLVKKCSDALNKNGMLIISDFIMNDNRTEPFYGAVFSLNMLVGTVNGDTYTETEIREWYTSAGFTKIERKNTSFGSDLIIGTK
ncbi:MAG: acetylserotonin O-methyltransferase [Ignavibacterium sp.]|nr:acetylserotonin O-methyltransferase [Ignavibacterium sp.]